MFRLSGIMDTINSTLAHGAETRLPKEFYDPKSLAIIEKIGVEEWFSGYQESQEYRSACFTVCYAFLQSWQPRSYFAKQ
jgi:hypothetical protein